MIWRKGGSWNRAGEGEVEGRQELVTGEILSFTGMLIEQQKSSRNNAKRNKTEQIK